MELYNGSDRHLDNAAAARDIANLKTPCSHCKKLFSSGNHGRHYGKCLYDPVNAKFCKGCGTQFYKPDNVFCCSSCSCSFNNKRRDPEISKKQGITLSDSYKSGKSVIPPRIMGSSRITIKACLICMQSFVQRGWGATRACKKTCSENCCYELQMKKANPFRCLSIAYEHKGKTLYMQSRWETAVADRLNLLNIDWARPRYIEWVDDAGKSRKYFPDFFLPAFDVFLDPKNLWVQMKDKRKIEIVSRGINLVVGELHEIIAYIESLVSGAGFEPAKISCV